VGEFDGALREYRKAVDKKSKNEAIWWHGLGDALLQKADI
jgi:hypothetical protein